MELWPRLINPNWQKLNRCIPFWSFPRCYNLFLLLRLVQFYIKLRTKLSRRFVNQINFCTLYKGSSLTTWFVVDELFCGNPTDIPCNWCWTQLFKVTHYLFLPFTLSSTVHFKLQYQWDRPICRYLYLWA